MKLPICLIGDDSAPFTELMQQLGKQAMYSVEPRLWDYSEAVERLRNKSGPLVAVVDIVEPAERAFVVAEEVKSAFHNVRIVMTSTSANPDIILRAMRSGAEEFLTQPFNEPEVAKALETIRRKIDAQPSISSGYGQIIAVSSILLPCAPHCARRFDATGTKRTADVSPCDYYRGFTAPGDALHVTAHVIRPRNG